MPPVEVKLPPTPALANSTKLLVVAVVAIAVALIIGIVTIAVAKPNENTLVIVTLLITFTTGTFASLYGAMKSVQTHGEMQALSLSVNGRLTQLLETSGGRQRAEGQLEGAAMEQARIAEQKIVTAGAAATVLATEATSAATVLATAAAAASAAATQLAAAATAAAAEAAATPAL